ncbi:MAG: 3-deoxy-8-phosphooctulonate synthase [Deltaproteobacteria bacterium]|nr:3-deoxy-8-phosphooctulonate synthase [Deltaproteobacteria bacterium]
MKVIQVKKLSLSDDSLFVIAGPCVIENEKDTIEAAKRLKEIAEELALPLVFKASYDKGNRSSVNSFRGPGIKAGLEILKKVGDQLDLPVISDIHGIEEIGSASQVLDIIQIPAFLCRQTDLLVETAKTGKVVNVKKGQFMAPWDMKNVIEKIRSAGNEKIILTERGSTFGYNNLVTDMRAFPMMNEFGYPVIFDATHSVQLPGGAGSSSAGQREFVAPLARAAVAAGARGLFLEVHENPEKALCDGPNSLAIDDVKALLLSLKTIHSAI